MARHAMREIRYRPAPKVIAIQADLFGGRDVEFIAAERPTPKTWGRDVLRYGRALAPQAKESAPLYLVGCVKTKAASPMAARDLYVSDWFTKARGYVEAVGGDWRILSAEHGLVDPGQVIAPYEATLSVMTSEDRAAWGHRVIGQLGKVPNAAVRPLILLAGKFYREPIETWAGARAVAPMVGLGLGAQKAWLLTQLEAASRRD